MVVKKRGISEIGIVRFQRLVLTETAAATFTEQEVDTQLSIERGFIWLIHLIEISIPVNSLDIPAAGGIETFTVQICRASQTGLVDIDDPDVVFRTRREIFRSTAIGTDAGPLWTVAINPIQYHYSPPLPYAGASIYIAVLGTATSAQSVRLRVGYTLTEVKDSEFFRVANAILS